MEKIIALLVGVCDYSALGVPSLPCCKNDLIAMKQALMEGLNVEAESIITCGESGVVHQTDVVYSLNQVAAKATADDIFVFYFTGHGIQNCLVVSDGGFTLQSLIDYIDQIPFKSKVAILDSCYSGGFALDDIPHLNAQDAVETFAGRGFAVMASCHADQESGFDNDKHISLYTRFVCDALTMRFLVRNGKKSLESINQVVFRLAELANKRKENIQTPIFRSSIGGTIYFEVEDYKPYNVDKVYEETDNYIIYDVGPVHTAAAKRLSAEVILRFPCSMNEIARYATEIKDKLMYCEIYQNRRTEEWFHGRPANIIWCYFGYDEDDITQGNFICHTTWVDDTQDKDYWYRISENTEIFNGVHLEKHPSYEMIRKVYQDNKISNEDLIILTRECTAKMISLAEEFIHHFREYANGLIEEELFTEEVQPICDELDKLYHQQADFPIPSSNLSNWSQAHANIAGTIHDFTLFHGRKTMARWTDENRKRLMQRAIERYESELEEIRKEDGLLEI